ncbi:hypothetical protein K1728_06415 [Weissella confusa]|uniref:hypothetical protein n=1 Tax=Weissella confusa TaxID=1583 RepID=UPI001C6FC2E0|nr:hypothetical protein [Weissella confusa]QYU56714.1 hypothetical protein K1728_05830 [Weissella confusa]QYU56825.1 hypothetical protein K1728_06415 [Weissella confusa]
MDLNKFRNLAYNNDELAILTVLSWLTETRPEMGEWGDSFFASRRWDEIKDDPLLQAQTLFEEFEAEFNDDNIDQECAYKQLKNTRLKRR